MRKTVSKSARAKKSSARTKKTSARAKKPTLARSKRPAAAEKSARGAGAKKSTPAAAAKKSAPAAATNSNGASDSAQPLVAKQPQSKQQAALKHGMFLHADDAWSLAYFNSNDLHCVERELFG